MKISDIKITTFKTYADRWDTGHAKPIPRADLMQTVLAIETDEGVTGYYFGGGSHGDAEGLNAGSADPPRYDAALPYRGSPWPSPLSHGTDRIRSTPGGGAGRR